MELTAPLTPAAQIEQQTPFRHSPVPDHAVPCQVRGNLPDWLRGDLFRTCPSVFASGDWRAEHWFDALGMVYAFQIGEGATVSWRGRALDSEMARDVRSKRVVKSSFGSPMQRGFWSRLLHPIPDPTDNANVNILPLGGECVALTESPYQLRLDPQSMEVRGRKVYRDGLPARLVMSAHPHYDSARQRIINVGSEMGRSSALVVFEHDPRGQQRQPVGRWSTRRVPYIHSFGLTPTQAVLFAHPFSVNPLSLLWSNRGFIDHFQWNPDEGTKVITLDRRDGQIREYEADSLFVFHTANAFETSDGVVLDVLAYDNPSIVDATRVSAMEHRLPDINARLVRIRLERGKARAAVSPLTEARFEFPRINYSRQSGSNYRWCWGAANDPQGPSYRSSIVKVDVQSGACRRFDEGDWVFGEPVFVGRPGASNEDDGVLATVATRAGAAASAMVVMDAATLEPLAWCEVPVSIPLGFHGSFDLRTGPGSASTHSTPLS